MREGAGFQAARPFFPLRSPVCYDHTAVGRRSSGQVAASQRNDGVRPLRPGYPALQGTGGGPARKSGAPLQPRPRATYGGERTGVGPSAGSGSENPTGAHTGAGLAGRCPAFAETTGTGRATAEEGRGRRTSQSGPIPPSSSPAEPSSTSPNGATPQTISRTLSSTSAMDTSPPLALAPRCPFPRARASLIAPVNFLSLA